MRPFTPDAAPAKAWIFPEGESPEVRDALAEALGMDPFLVQLLVQRGIRTFDESKAFFRPNWNDLGDPSLMKGMDKALETMAECIDNGERILLYGDYDVDGTTSVALCFRFLRKYCADIGYYIPDRRSEGYGLSQKGLDWAVQNGFRCVVTLDCGTTAFEQVDYANTLGLKVIITDHHKPSDRLPKAHAILNPLQPGCPYAFKDLSGCGVAFKFLVALCHRFEWPMSELLDQLELVAISIAADMVPLTGENRVLTHYGLQKLNNNPSIGIRTMLQHYKNRKPTLDLGDVIFGLAPRINAAGRMGDARLAVQLLVSEDPEECARLAAEIENSNLDRRDTDTEITRIAIEQALTMHQSENKMTTVVCGSEWHKGVIGIVASRLVERFYKPTVVFCLEGEKMTGSARSVQGFDLYNALQQCADTIEQFGGHKFAAGLTLKASAYEDFCQRFEEAVAATLEPWQQRPSLPIDLEMPLEVITPKFFRILKQFAPFGQGNRQPVFCSRGVYASPGSPRIVGQNHLSLNLQQKDGRTSLPAIAFGQAALLPLLAKGLPFDIAYSLDENYYRGQSDMQLRILDLRPGGE